MRDPTTVEAFARFTPLHRLASTDEIQGLALFLSVAGGDLCHRIAISSSTAASLLGHAD